MEKEEYKQLQSFLRPVVHFKRLKRLYAKPLVSGTILEEVRSEYVLWEGYVEIAQPPLIIYDDQGMVNDKRYSYTLQVMDDKDWLLNSIPEKIKDKIEEYEELTGKRDDGTTPEIIYQPLQKIDHPEEVFRRINWKKVVEDLTNFKGQPMDERLRIIRLCHLLKGITQATNPAAIICLPGQMGKSAMYNVNGGIINEKCSAISMVGYATSDGQMPGDVDNTMYTYAIDQFESQGEWQIFRYLQSLMESGIARVSNAAQPFTVKSTAIFVILANPGYSEPTKSFGFILDHMVREPSFGRRFGVILYDTEGRRFDKREGDVSAWEALFEFFRALEDAVTPQIEVIFRNEDVWNWLNSKRFEWIANMNAIIEPLVETKKGKKEEDTFAGLAAFLREFVSNGITHTKGGALRGAIAMNLDKVVLGTITIPELLTQADDILSELLDINEDSIRRIAVNFKEEKKMAMKSYYDSRPSYLKEIIQAVEAFKMQYKDVKEGRPSSTVVRSIEFKPSDGAYLSAHVHLALRGNPERHNPKLKEFFGFELRRDSGELIALIHSYDLSGIGALQTTLAAATPPPKVPDNQSTFAETTTEQKPADQTIDDELKNVELWVCKCGVGPIKNGDTSYFNRHLALVGGDGMEHKLIPYKTKEVAS